MKQLFFAPTGAGKTHFAIRQALASAEAQQSVRVCVKSNIQAKMWQQRLAAEGGALGVRVQTFDKLIADCLRAARVSYTRLPTPVLLRLIQQIAQQTELRHYAPLQATSGFASVLQKLFREFKQSLIFPEELAGVVDDFEEERLKELALLYFHYQHNLQAKQWADGLGLHWLTSEQLNRQSHIGRDWDVLIVDGFDQFTAAQLDIFRQLSERVAQFTLLLTDSETVEYEHFQRTRAAVEQELGLSAEPLPPQPSRTDPALRQLTDEIFTWEQNAPISAESVQRLELPTQPDEVRAALRWLKHQIVVHGIDLNQTALLARDIVAYRPFIQQTAAEFGLPIRLVGRQPLHQNPAVAALLNLLALALPIGGEAPLPRRAVLEAWRSPYFDWPSAEIAITPAAATQLEQVALAGRTIAGRGQWNEAFERAKAQIDANEEEEDSAETSTDLSIDELASLFDAFVTTITPPASGSMRDYAIWLEALMGPDADQDGDKSAPPMLNLLARVRHSAEDTPLPTTLVDTDIAALVQFKNVLRRLVWTEDALALTESLTPMAFFNELRAAVEATSFYLPTHSGSHILVADVNEARGLSFEAVAILGMAEGVFPQPSREDPFLRDDDRQSLCESGLDIELSTLSSEREFFYDALGRARSALLLTRPRLADSGAAWKPSPFWDEVGRRVSAEAQQHAPLTPADAASLSELLTIGARQPQWGHALFADRYVDAWQQVQHAGRQLRQPASGRLQRFAGQLQAEFGPDHVWSVSRLEAYRSCGYRFFVDSVLALEPPIEPEMQLSALDLGLIYHNMLEAVYQSKRVLALLKGQPRDEEAISAEIRTIAQPILDAAPDAHGFRPTPWWSHTQLEIMANVVASVLAMADQANGFEPQYREQWVTGTFGEGEQAFTLRGVVDRIDVDATGHIRIVDYKLAGKSSYTKKHLEKGQRLQLPLYAIAAQQTLRLGPIADGFYWHVVSAEASSLSLASFGVQEAIDTAEYHAHVAIAAIQDGDFAPQPPDGGCPSYCPALSFCWMAQPAR